MDLWGQRGPSFDRESLVPHRAVAEDLMPGAWPTSGVSHELFTLACSNAAGALASIECGFWETSAMGPLGLSECDILAASYPA